MPETLAVIPARGGSKRLPRKNIQDFHGKPIIAYTIEAALESGCFSKVAVSTEDAEIAEVATRFGAQVFFRDERLATDEATLKDVFVDLLTRERAAGCDYDWFACLVSTAPFRNAEDIRQTVSLLERGKCHHVMAVTRYGHYAHQALKVSSGSAASPMWPDLCELRGDRLPELVADAGSAYAVFVDEFLAKPGFFAEDMRVYRLPFMRAVDIDTPDDFRLAWCIAACRDKPFPV